MWRVRGAQGGVAVKKRVRGDQDRTVNVESGGAGKWSSNCGVECEGPGRVDVEGKERDVDLAVDVEGKRPGRGSRCGREG